MGHRPAPAGVPRPHRGRDDHRPDVGCRVRHGRTHPHVCRDRLGRHRRRPGRQGVGDRKAHDRGLSARFLQLDARDLDELDETFDTVLDCGLFHVFDPDARPAYLAGLAAATGPGARYFMLCFSDQQPGESGPHRVSRSEIIAAFADGWRIDAIEPARIEVTIDPDGIRAWAVAATRV